MTLTSSFPSAQTQTQTQTQAQTQQESKKITIPRRICQTLPLFVIHWFRDYGVLRVCFDLLALFLGLTVCLQYPSLLLQFLRIGRQLKSIRYGETPKHQMLIGKVNYHPDQTTTTGTKDADCLRCRAAIFIHGGAWSSGELWMYRLTAYQFAVAMRAEYVVILGYPVYPQACIQQQRDSVIAALHYLKTHESIVLPGQSPSIHILSGYSSGANIGALAILKECSVGNKLVDGFLGFSGVYDMSLQHRHEIYRGIQEASLLCFVTGGKNKLEECSPTVVAKELITSKSSKVLMLLKELFVFVSHVESDVTVPIASSKEFAKVLSTVCENVETIFPTTGDHMDCVLHTTFITPPPQQQQNSKKEKEQQGREQGRESLNIEFSDSPHVQAAIRMSHQLLRQHNNNNNNNKKLM